ncbi:precorrin-2 dehydrogenase/sirohydrochlorin ferrochelatase family protein [Marinimicrococcus flavescens]|uniref:precorrin-2 dehydrogenase n=1 Tax=Marinimicrococcus flavescens TaxID=3031815 RepID=A0AAP4D5T9_9PROT|nr:NAD(P)-dependent oxidoreductase [Marinimicrococcus flavescens]
MLPIVVDAGRLEIALAGQGEAFARRMDWLLAGGASRLTLFTEDPACLASRPESVALVPRLPHPGELGGFHLLWVAGLPLDHANGLARAARSIGLLVNVEDVLRLCDFHTPAVVRRGDLVVGISTGGRSPALAVRLRRWLEDQLGEEWAGRLELLARKRTAWRRRKRPLSQLAALADATIDRHDWLPGERGA